MSDSSAWEKHWQEYSESNTLNPAQEYRRRLIFEALELENDKVIRLVDIGSGQGEFLTTVNKRYPEAQLLGVELTQSGVEIAKEKVPTAHFTQRDLLKKEEIPEPFRHWATHAVCSEVLEHVDDPKHFIENIKPLLTKDCRLVFTVPGGPMSCFDKHLGHQRHFNTNKLRELFTSADYEITKLRSAGFPFFNIYRLAVIARGEKLIADVSSEKKKKLPITAKVSMSVFKKLFRANSTNTPWGWQMLAVVRI